MLDAMKTRSTIGTPGRPAHRARRAPFKQDQIVYEDLQNMAKMAVKDESNFITLTKQNKIKDLSKYVGYEMIGDQESYMILKSGRQVQSTYDWNPLTFALMLEKDNLVRYILDEVNFNMP